MDIFSAIDYFVGMFQLLVQFVQDMFSNITGFPGMGVIIVAGIALSLLVEFFFHK